MIPIPTAIKQAGLRHDYEAGYAPNGNILTHTDSVMGTWNFSYDAVDRLTAAAIGSNAPTPFQNQTASWTYDAFGNRTGNRGT